MSNEIVIDQNFFERAQSRISKYSYLQNETKLVPVIIVGNVVTRILEDIFATFFPSDQKTRLIIWLIIFLGLWFFYWIVDDLLNTFQTQPFKNEKLRARLIELGWLQPETVTISQHDNKPAENVTLDVLKNPDQEKALKSKLGRETQAWIYWIKIIDWLQTVKIVILGFVINGFIGVLLEIIDPNQWYYKVLVWTAFFVGSIIFVKFLNLLLSAYEIVFVEPLKGGLKKILNRKRPQPLVKNRFINNSTYTKVDYNSD